MVCTKPSNTSDKHKRRVLIVDDHAVVREGLTDLINREDDLVVCGCTKDMPETVGAIKNRQPDVITVDISLEGASGLELIEHIKAQFPGLPMLVLSMHGELFYVRRAIQAGARGYITKKEAIKQIIVAIRTVLDGRLYLSDVMKEELLCDLIGGSATKVDPSPIDRLTGRELEVFRLLGQGRATRQIAEQLYVSVKTVETYRSRIKEKLNLANGSELMLHAFQWVTGAQNSV